MTQDLAQQLRQQSPVRRQSSTCSGNISNPKELCNTSNMYRHHSVESALQADNSHIDKCDGVYLVAACMSLSALDPAAGHVICSLQMQNRPESASQRLRLGSKQHEAAAADQDLPYASQRLLSSTTHSVFLLNTGFEGLP